MCAASRATEVQHRHASVEPTTWPDIRVGLVSLARYIGSVGQGNCRAGFIWLALSHTASLCL